MIVDLKTILCIFILAGTGLLEAQQLTLISSGGGLVNQGAVRGSYSIGETFIETFSTSASSLTQGFNQSFVLSTSTNELPVAVLNIRTYPNPFQSELFIQIEGSTKASFIRVDDLKGRLELMQPLDTYSSEQVHRINTDRISSGFHLLSVLDEKKNVIYSITIVKI